MRSVYRLVSRTEVAKTRPVLERAGWRCEGQGCTRDENLRVVERVGKPREVLCRRCRMGLGDVVEKLPASIFAKGDHHGHH